MSSRIAATVLIVFVLAFAYAANAQGIGGRNVTAEIKGRVYVANNQPAPNGAMVLLERADSGVVGNAQTDSAGKFEFRGLSQQPYVIRVTLRGYETHQEYVDLTLNAHGYVVITLRPQQAADAARSAPPSGELAMRDALIPKEALKEFERGKKLLVEKSDFEGAIKHFQKAIEQHDNFPQAFILLGAALVGQQKIDQAENAYRSAIQRDANMAEAYVALGTLQNGTQHFADAEKTLLRAVELKPESYEAQYELGKSFWVQHKNDQAVLHAQKALQLNEKSSEAHLLMGNVLVRKGDIAGALRDFKESLRLDPNNRYAAATKQMIDTLESNSTTPK